MKRINWTVIVTLLVLTGVIVVALIGLQEWLVLARQNGKSQAVQGCFETSKREWTDGNKSGIEVDPLLYKQCLGDKGY